ncbi:MAG: HEAT repeat domain-containing protein, partial [Chloroflexota bacterium]
HPDPRMRTSAVFAMGRSCDLQWLADLLHEMESDDPQMRFEAARAAGELEDPRAVPRLLRLLFDPDLEVRLTAVQSLGAIGGEQAISALRTLTESENKAVAEAAEEALAEAQFAESPFSFGAEDLPHTHKKGDD